MAIDYESVGHFALGILDWLTFNNDQPYPPGTPGQSSVARQAFLALEKYRTGVGAAEWRQAIWDFAEKLEGYIQTLSEDEQLELFDEHAWDFELIPEVIALALEKEGDWWDQSQKEIGELVRQAQANWE